MRLNTEKYVGIQYNSEKGIFEDISREIEYETESEGFNYGDYRKAVTVLEKENPEFKQIEFTNVFGTATNIAVHPNITVRTYGVMVFKAGMSITVAANNVDVKIVTTYRGEMDILLLQLNSVIKNKSMDKYLFINKSRELLKCERDFDNATEDDKKDIKYTIDGLKLDIMELESVM